MPKRKQRNKPYKARPVNPNALDWAISGAHTLPMHKQLELIGYVDVALGLLREGRAGREDWNTFANGMNIAEALAFYEIGPNLLPEIHAAQAALHSVALRMLAGRSSTLYASELAAIREGREMYRAQLHLCSQAEVHRAVTRVNNLHRSGAMDNVAHIYQQMAAASHRTALGGNTMVGGA